MTAGLKEHPNRLWEAVELLGVEALVKLMVYTGDHRESGKGMTYPE